MNFIREGSFFKIPRKFWDIQITTDFECPYFNFQCQWTRKQDHAGFQLLIEVYRFMFDFNIYDSRHWNEETGEYYEPTIEPIDEPTEPPVMGE